MPAPNYLTPIRDMVIYSVLSLSPFPFKTPLEFSTECPPYYVSQFTLALFPLSRFKGVCGL